MGRVNATLGDGRQNARCRADIHKGGDQTGIVCYVDACGSCAGSKTRYIDTETRAIALVLARLLSGNIT